MWSSGPDAGNSSVHVDVYILIFNMYEIKEMTVWFHEAINEPKHLKQTCNIERKMRMRMTEVYSSLIF